MKKITIDLETLKAEYAIAGDSEKKLLEKLYPDVFEKPDPYLEACKKLGKKPRPALEDLTDPDQVASDAFYRLIICIRAKNMINGKVWKKKYDGSEKHYFPYFDCASGFEFSHTNCGYDLTRTYVGARLEYRTQELANEGGIEFLRYYLLTHTENN